MNTTLKYFFGIILLLAVAGAAVFLLQSSEEPQEDQPIDRLELSRYFGDRMVALAATDIGNPKEGFNAELLRLAFPGLEARDFNGVEAFEGVYRTNGDEVSFERKESKAVSTAERTISEAGYQTLLDNVSARLMYPVTDEEDVDEILRLINTGERFTARIDEGGGALGVKVIPHEILEDSRCPIDVTCIQAGTVRVRTTLESGLGAGSQIFELNQPITTEAEEVTLVSVEPIRESGTIPEPEAYIFTFEVRKR